MITTPTMASQQIGTGTSVSGRVRVSSLRAFPVITGVESSVAGHTCALMETGVVDGYRPSTTDAFLTTGAFPGPSAWSPPS